METPIDPKPEARAAATWWADKLTSDTRHDLGGRDAAEQAATATFNVASVMLRQRFTPAQADRFADALATLIDQHLRGEAPQQDFARLAIHCDYGIDPVLAEAATRAGLSVSMFDLPMKTNMWIIPGRVTVSEGYGAPDEVVWAA
ncbi:DUF2267 domain-containing protein [Salinispora vitiensis]|uniref:DUF2267 domain-containing protein n=1 Tax=Salinispora vitiensis TaxID=999544 RepID=UPI000367DF1D|nr:DUF2267 domain-containing protein [Salinispora vitiensis]